MVNADSAPPAVLVTWSTVDRTNSPVSSGRAVAGRNCARCALDVGLMAMGTRDVIDADDLLKHTSDCGLVAIEDAAEAAGQDPNFDGDWPI